MDNKNLEMLKKELQNDLAKEILTEYQKGKEGSSIRQILLSYFNSDKGESSEVKKDKD